MFRVAVVLLQDMYLYSIGGVLDAFQIADDHVSRQRGQPTRHFECRTVALSREPVTASCGVRVQPDVDLESIGETDLIYVPAFRYDGVPAFENLVEHQKSLLQWLRHQWKQGGAIAANCTGTLILAQTGLLNGRKATTAWWLERVFRKRYPQVGLDANALFCEDHRLLTTGAMTSNLSMAMHLIGREVGPHLAAVCARTMLVETGARTQRPYQELMEIGLSPDPLVARTQYWLQNHLGDPIDQKSLAKRMNVSQRTLIRRFKSELDVPPLAYLQNLRVEASKRLLEDSLEPLSDIVERVGYTDVSSFSRLFKARTGLTPNAYRDRFGRQI